MSRAVNTGCREQEICNLKWEWEVNIPELNTNVFILPEHITKNNEERVVVLNSVSLSVVEAQRSKHPSRVFTCPKGNLKHGTSRLESHCVRSTILAGKVLESELLMLTSVK